MLSRSFLISLFLWMLISFFLYRLKTSNFYIQYSAKQIRNSNNKYSPKDFPSGYSTIHKLIAFPLIISWLMITFSIYYFNELFLKIVYFDSDQIIAKPHALVFLASLFISISLVVILLDFILSFFPLFHKYHALKIKFNGRFNLTAHNKFIRSKEKKEINRKWLKYINKYDPDMMISNNWRDNFYYLFNFWLICGILLIIGFNIYARVDGDCVYINRMWSIREEKYKLDDVLNRGDNFNEIVIPSEFKQELLKF